MACKECGKDKKIVARGWCRACYSRWYNKGTASYSPRPEKVACSVGGCNDLAIAKGMCDKHYRRVKKHGDPDHGSSPDWGKRSKHPLYNSWGWMRRYKSILPVCDEWLEDFWQFAFDVGERPSKKHKLFRADNDYPLGVDNFVWKRSFIERVDGEDERTYLARRQRASRALNIEAHQGYELKRSYGISSAKYDEMSEAQDHKCKICGNPENVVIRGKTISLAVDHCHETGDVRGLLCSKCNQGLGCFKDSPDLLAEAIKYLNES